MIEASIMYGGGKGTLAWWCSESHYFKQWKKNSLLWALPPSLLHYKVEKDKKWWRYLRIDNVKKFNLGFIFLLPLGHVSQLLFEQLFQISIMNSIFSLSLVNWKKNWKSAISCCKKSHLLLEGKKRTNFCNDYC